jgi:predicted O-methyltransferase YrrM
LIQIHGSRKILEIGLSTGYTSLWMASVFKKSKNGETAMDSESNSSSKPGNIEFKQPITTIDYHSRLVAEAKRYFNTAGAEHLIRILNEDAIDALLKLREEQQKGAAPFDFVFQDGGKSTL